MSLVIDLTTHSGAYATRLLAEAGYDVVRLESPQGDALRRMGPFLGHKPDLEHGAYHQFLNAGKRSLALNLDFSSGPELFLNLVRGAEAMVATLPLPLEEELLLDANPRLVLTKVEDAGPEICAVARSGLLSLTGHPGNPPLLLGGHVIYAATGLYIAVATALGLFHSQRTGQGQQITVSVKQCLETLVEQAMIEYTFTGEGTERRGGRGTITATSGALPCKDGYWMLSLIHRVEGWKSLMDWMQDPALMADPSLAEEENRHKKRDFILDRIQAWANRFTKTELVAEAQKRHIPASPVSTPLDLADDPQLLARGFLKEIEHPEFGCIKFPLGAIATLRGAPIGLAPTLGQHNTEILQELGYSDADIEALVATGVM